MLQKSTGPVWLHAGLVMPGIWSLQLVPGEREWQGDVEIRAGEVTVVRRR